MLVTWGLSPDDSPKFTPRRVIRYEILRAPASADTAVQGEDDFKPIGDATYESTRFKDSMSVERGQAYRYQVVAVAPDGSRSEASASGEAAIPTLQWFDWSRAWYAGILGLVCAGILYFISAAHRGRSMTMRRIPALDAITEAVGRATEMGRKSLFVPGIMDINEIQTVAGLTLLSQVACTTAEYGSRVEVPTSRALVMTAARETMQAAYLSAGRPEDYNLDDAYYVTDEQFGYAVAVTGTMVREKPAACFYFGQFFAESLFLAETGNMVGAIQIAGTAEASQLPFFVSACDYTLIGEEFFAASAYLSGQPHQLGSLKGQDAGKVLAALLMVIGCVWATLTKLFPESPELQLGFDFMIQRILGG